MDCTERRAMQWRVRPPGKGPLGIFRVLHGPDPTKPASKGLYQRVRRTIGIGVSGLSDEEMLHRAAKRRKLLNEAQPYSPDMLPHIIPGWVPIPRRPRACSGNSRLKSRVFMP